MRFLALFVLAAISCKAKEERSPSETDTSPPPTGLASGPIDSASCETTDHPLVFACTARTEVSAATWTFESNGHTRTFQTSGPDHALTAWGLREDSTYTYRVEVQGGAAAGSVTTPTLPEGIRVFEAEVDGDASMLEHIAVSYTCEGQAGVALFDTKGRVVWYHQGESMAAGALTGVSSFGFSPTNELVIVEGGRHISLVGPTGPKWTNPTLPRWMHHNSSTNGTHVFALNAYESEGVILDGFYVLDHDTGELLATWDLEDHVTVGEGGGDRFWTSIFPTGRDWSHANSIDPDGPDHVLMSFRWLHAAMRVVSNPEREDFGTIEWIMTGNTSEVESDITGGDFIGQHHVSRLSDGGIGLFDNREGPVARAVFYDVDPDSGTATETASFELKQACHAQGSAYELEDGVLATCSTHHEALIFENGAADPIGSVTSSCGPGTASGLIPRFIPIAL